MPLCWPERPEAGPDSQGLEEIDSSATDSGTFVRFDAGSELVIAWSPGKAVAESCVAEGAATNAEAYSSTLFTTHGDVAWQEYLGR